jgi:hypothetical protein
MIGSFFDIFTLYFEIFTNKTIGQFSGQENDHEKAETAEEEEEEKEEAEELRESEETSANDWITNNCFNLLEIDSLLAGLMGFVPKLLRLDEREAELDTFEISLAQKYLSFLINYISLKQTYLNEPINDLATSEALQDADRVDLTINKSSILFSFVQIFARFMANATAFARLIAYFLRFVEAYFSSSSSSSDDNSRSLVKFDRDLVYLWLLLSKKWLLAANDDTAAVLVEYMFICLNNLLDTRQLNGLLFKMKHVSADFSEIFVFVCLKCYQSLSGRDNGPSEVVKSFLVDYLFSSSVIRHTQGTLTTPSSLFKSYLDNAQNGDEDLAEKLEEKLNLVKSLYKKKQTVRLENEDEQFVIEVYSQAFIYCFQETNRLAAEAANSGQTSRQVLGLNLSLRTRHLLYLVGLLFNKVIWEIINP